MNKLQTLIKCRNLWAWLAITGSNDKCSYKPARRWAYACPCCMYAGAVIKNGEHFEYNRNCNKCPLNDYAWSTGITRRIHCQVTHSSFYGGWRNAYLKEDRKYWAMRMVQACDRAIEDLILKGK